MGQYCTNQMHWLHVHIGKLVGGRNKWNLTNHPAFRLSILTFRFYFLFINFLNNVIVINLLNNVTVLPNSLFDTVKYTPSPFSWQNQIRNGYEVKIETKSIDAKKLAKNMQGRHWLLWKLWWQLLSAIEPNVSMAWAVNLGRWRSMFWPNRAYH